MMPKMWRGRRSAIPKVTYGFRGERPLTELRRLVPVTEYRIQHSYKYKQLHGGTDTEVMETLPPSPMPGCLVVNCRTPDCGTAWAALQPQRRIKHTVGCPSKPLMDPAGNGDDTAGSPAWDPRAPRRRKGGRGPCDRSWRDVGNAQSVVALVRFPAPWVATPWLTAHGLWTDLGFHGSLCHPALPGC